MNNMLVALTCVVAAWAPSFTGTLLEVITNLVQMVTGIIIGVLAALVSSLITDFFIMFPLLTALAGFILMLAAFRHRGNRRTRR